LYYRYAEKFGCHPQDVPRVVTVQAFMRWLMIEKTDASRQIWKRWEAAEKPSELKLTKEENELRKWALDKESY